METPSELIARAEGLCKPSFFKRVLGSGANYDEAAAIYMKVANGYKMNKCWDEAEACFIRAAETSELADDKVQAANMYVEAGHCKLKCDENNCQGHMPSAYGKACEIYTSGGRFGQAGRIMKTIAEEFEKRGLSEEAMEYWKKAADYYENDEFGASMRSKALEHYLNGLALYKEDYRTCLQNFEELANSFLRNNLLQYQAKEFYFRAFLMCLLDTSDAITASVHLKEYQDKDPGRFGTSREFKLCQSICEALEQDNIDSFTEAVTAYSNITPIDNWKTVILSRIKSRLFTQRLNHVDADVGSNLPVPVGEETLNGEIDLT